MHRYIYNNNHKNMEKKKKKKSTIKPTLDSRVKRHLLRSVLL